MTVNADAASAGDNNALFETWASDGDTFRAKPVWPSGGSQMQIGARALSLAIEQLHPHVRPELPTHGEPLDRRGNPPQQAGLRLHRSKQPVQGVGVEDRLRRGEADRLPGHSIEVKANWVEVGRLKEFNGFAGSPAEAAAAYHVNETGGKQYALVSFHIISNRVPNWTWATFEHKDNPGRCDVLGCKDSFGAVDAYVAPLSQVESQTHYPDCAKSPALLALFAKAHLDPAFSNYCLKGSQSDFADPSGAPIRLGNSVTEQTFVAQSSCMTCHGRAGFDAAGRATTPGGFDPTPIDGPPGSGDAPVGPIDSSRREGGLRCGSGFRRISSGRSRSAPSTTPPSRKRQSRGAVRRSSAPRSNLVLGA